MKLKKKKKRTRGSERVLKSKCKGESQIETSGAFVSAEMNEEARPQFDIPFSNSPHDAKSHGGGKRQWYSSLSLP